MMVDLPTASPIVNTKHTMDANISVFLAELSGIEVSLLWQCGLGASIIPEMGGINIFGLGQRAG